MTDMIRVLYNPTTGMVGCVLLQALCEGSSRIPAMFDTKDWETFPEPGQVVMEATFDQWRMVADMDRAERVARWKATT